MKRDEYLKALENALDFLDADTRRAAVSFYAEMLDDRIENGMDEESAVDDLESIEAIAARLQSENDLPHSAQTPACVKPRKESEKQKQEDRSNDEYQTYTYHGSADTFKSLRVLVCNRPVEIHFSDTSEVTLQFNALEGEEFAFRNQEGDISLIQEKAEFVQSFHLFNLNINMKDFPFAGLFRGKTLNMVDSTIWITLPAGAAADLNIESKNGHILIKGGQGLRRVQFKTTNSRITAQDLSCLSIDAKTSNGHIAFSGVSASEDMRARSSNGRIEFSSCTCRGAASLVTSNARITLEGVSAEGRLEAVSSNGAISVSAISAPDISLSTSNGTIAGTLPGAMSDWRIDSGSSNGHNSLPKFQNGAKPLHVHTSNGSIRLDFENA